MGGSPAGLMKNNEMKKTMLHIVLVGPAIAHLSHRLSQCNLKKGTWS